MGGTAKGQEASGTTVDGTYWFATILRQNASNGECAGVLNLTVDGKTVKEVWNWDKVFESSGIPIVNAGAKISRESSIVEKIC